MSKKLTLLSIFFLVSFGLVIFWFPKEANAATEFVTTVNTDGGGDYSSLSAWEAAINCDLTTATTKVFSHGGITGTIADGATVTGATSGATSTVRHVTATQILMSGINGTFQSGEQVYQTQNVNYVVLSSAGDSAIARVNCSGATADTTAVTIAGWTTSATNYISIQGDNTSGKWDTTKYILNTTDASGITIFTGANFITIHGLQIETDNDAAQYTGAIFVYLNDFVASNVAIKNNILYATLNVANTWGIGLRDHKANSSATIYNNIIYGWDSTTMDGVNVADTQWNNVLIYNNTISNCTNGILLSAGTVTAKNNAVFNNTDDFFGTMTLDYNASDDGDGTNAVDWTNEATDWANVFVDYVNKDFHLNNFTGTGKIIDIGTDLSATFITDIDGETRGTLSAGSGLAWDIGADEFVDATAPTSTSITSISENPDSAYQYVSGTNAVYYNTATSSGSFIVNATSTDAESGIQKITFPSLTDFSATNGGDDSSAPFAWTYNWTSTSTHNGIATSTAYNNTSLTASTTFYVYLDTTAPSGGSLDFTDGYYTATSVIISYATGTDSGSGVDTSTGKIQRREAALSGGTCGSYGSWADLATEYDGSYTDTTVVTAYCYQYQYLIADNVANWATASSTNAAKIDTAAPSCSLVSLTADSSSQITLVATSSDAVSGLHATPYWFIATSSGSGISSSTDWQAAVSFVDAGLSPNTQYTYQVKARNTAGNESAYATASSTYTLANVPAALSATADSATQLTASWTANSNPAGTYYYLENTTNATNSGWITAVSYASTGLSCNTSYSFRVKARNGDSVETSWSDTVSQTTSACPATGGGGGGNFLIYSSPPATPTVVPPKETPRPIYGIPELIQKIPEVVKKIPEVFAPETPSLSPIPGIESTPLVFPSLKIGLEPLTRKIRFSLDWDSLREYLATDKDQPLFVAESKIPLFSQMITEKLRQIRVAMRTKLQVLIRPKKPIKTLTAELLLKKITKKDQAFAQIDPSLISAELRRVLAADKPGYKIADYQFADPDQDGVWTADLVVPAIDGIYTFRTILAFQDGETKIEETEIMVEPEGYVYERIKNQELRIKDARISLYWFNPLTKQYQLWPGEEFDQKNPQVTNQRGTYKFTAPEGKYYLTAAAEGYQPCQSEEFEIAQGGGIIRNIEMRTTRKFVTWPLRNILIISVLIFLFLGFVVYYLLARKVKSLT